MSHEHDSSYKYLFSAPEMVRDLILRTLTGLTPLLGPFIPAGTNEAPAACQRVSLRGAPISATLIVPRGRWQRNASSR